MELKSDQAKAFEKLKVFLNQGGGGFFLLSGAAGTGKTYLMREVVEYIQSTSDRQIVLTAPTHKAVKVLQRFTPDKVDCMTIHSALALTEYIDGHGNVTFKRQNGKIAKLVDYHILIVDESSMIPDIVFYDLTEFVNTGMKIIFLGDPFQLPPVNNQESLVFEKDTQIKYNFQIAYLQEIIRQQKDSPIIKFAHTFKNAIYKPVVTFDPLNDITPFGEVRYASRRDVRGLTDEILPFFESDMFKADPDYIKIVAWRNTTVKSYNRLIREHLFGDNLPGLIVGDKIIFTQPVLDGNRVLISINDEGEILELTIEDEEIDDGVTLKCYKAVVRIQKELSIYNNYSIKIVHEDSIGDYQDIITLLKKYALQQKQGSFYARNAWIDYYEFQKRFAQVLHNYSITAHRAQGSTYENTIVMLYDALYNKNVYERNRLIYTAVTRASHRLWVVE